MRLASEHAENESARNRAEARRTNPRERLASEHAENESARNAS